MNLENIGKNIRKIRGQKSQPWVAEAANIGKEHLSRIENGKKGLSLDSLLDLCEALETTPNDILMGEYKLTAEVAGASLQQLMANLSPRDRTVLLEIAESMARHPNKNTGGG